MYDGASELYNDLLSDYFDKYKDFLDGKNNRVGSKYNRTNLFLDANAHKK